ncbi:MAG: transglycosylase SLT domain-containing protein [Blastocatellia bacterium]
MLRVAVWLLAILGAGAGVVTPSDHLLSKIEEGRELLKTESVQMITGTVGTRRVRVGRRQYKEVPITGIIGREMALAILDADGSIRLARAIKRDPGFEVLSPDFILSMRRENGINSDIAVISPAGGKVVAVKYPVSNESNRFGPGDSVIQAVYTPYSAEIKTEDVVKKGIDVKNGFIEKAYSRLRARAVLSRAFPGRRVVDVIPKDVLRVLLLNEHIDPGEFKSAGLTKPLAERVLTVIGTNREKAYAYSISSAGARGLVQMIPSTYTLLMNRYSAAGLKADFHSAMADPINAVMAQVLLCDSDWESIRARTDMPAERVGPYLAAAYNGGVGRVLSVLSNEQTDWMEDPDSNSRPTRTVSKKVPVRIRTRSGRVAKRYVVKRYTQPIFKNETSKYVAQYHWISDYLAERSKPGTPPRNVEAR